jgi:metal-responsive CopG/Arc/MetJ family transcriptional regulator
MHWRLATTITLSKKLFDQSKDLARKLKVSRNRLFVMALEGYIQRQKNQNLLAQINKVYEDAPPDKAERLYLRHMRRQHRRMIEGEW